MAEALHEEAPGTWPAHRGAGRGAGGGLVRRAVGRGADHGRPAFHVRFSVTLLREGRDAGEPARVSRSCLLLSRARLADPAWVALRLTVPCSLKRSRWSNLRCRLTRQRSNLRQTTQLSVWSEVTTRQPAGACGQLAWAG